MRVPGAVAVVLAMAWAGDVSASGLGQPEPWQLGLQQAATPVARSIASFHNFLLLITVAISAICGRL